MSLGWSENDQFGASSARLQVCTGGAGHGPQQLKHGNHKAGFMKNYTKGAKLRAKKAMTPLARWRKHLSVSPTGLKADAGNREKIQNAERNSS